MRLRLAIAGLTLAAAVAGLPGTALAAPAPLARHEAACQQAHRSTAPPDADRALHERVPPTAMDQLCDPHRGHEDGR